MNPTITIIRTKTDVCQSCGLDRNVARDMLQEPLFIMEEDYYTGMPRRVINETRDLAEKAAYDCEECRKVLGLDD